MRRYANFKKRKPMAEMNIVPYVDVMLVLLVIFMITAPLLSRGVDVQLPQAQAKKLSQNKVPIVVTVDGAGKYYLNIAKKPQKPIAAKVLQVRVAAELSRNKQRPVMVRGDKNVKYGQVVKSMVLLQQAGAGKVGLITESPERKSS